ncbi:hypothetical protein I7I48_12224 [Histoplasma ohiense]|nr:hypothetical protein I7I48_12224 [Histoplasma ohiense (nom. inval.)]
MAVLKASATFRCYSCRFVAWPVWFIMSSLVARAPAEIAACDRLPEERRTSPCLYCAVKM